MSDSSRKKRPSINLSLFINLSESFSSDHGSKSPNSPTDFKATTKSPRNFEGGVVGLGIVAAMNETIDAPEAFSSAKASKIAKIAVSPRSQPIPIVSANPITYFRGPSLEMDDMELSESYTCVISHLGNNSIRKREYFGKPDNFDDNNWGNYGVFFASPPNYVHVSTEYEASDFLNSCYLCKKKLHGMDIFMYRGEKAFCSVECRCKQILCEEHKEKCGFGIRKPFDYSVSPCSVPRLFSAGVAAA